MVKSVFWGSILAAMITCGITFILNLLWITCRQIGLWWIKRIGEQKYVSFFSNFNKTITANSITKIIVCNFAIYIMYYEHLQNEIHMFAKWSLL